ncbi:MAG TPA: NAD(+) diphosphatase [Candidatus Deferrimicrobium sp.]|nr:NAD(+) diphosphatase [Candidatus Deferrimicrobium sp.]
MRFVPAVASPHGAGLIGWWFLFHGDRLLVETRGDAFSIPRWHDPEKRGLRPLRTQYIGTLDDDPCYAAELSEPVESDGTSFRSLRPLLGMLPDALFSVAGRAFQTVDWDRTSRYCGKCGMRTEPVDGERAKVCPSCGQHFFPRVSPAVIVAVVKDRKLLLARGRRFPSAFHSVLAGFVEPGETFEECVHREVKEEVGVTVTDPRYFGNQPWPFPHSLMVGFTAEYAGGELVLEEREIANAGWFDPEEIAKMQIPRRGTIARRLIDWFLAGRAAP